MGNIPGNFPWTCHDFTFLGKCPSLGMASDFNLRNLGVYAKIIKAI